MSGDKSDLNEVDNQDNDSNEINNQDGDLNEVNQDSERRLVTNHPIAPICHSVLFSDSRPWPSSSSSSSSNVSRDTYNLTSSFDSSTPSPENLSDLSSSSSSPLSASSGSSTYSDRIPPSVINQNSLQASNFNELIYSPDNPPSVQENSASVVDFSLLGLESQSNGISLSCTSTKQPQELSDSSVVAQASSSSNQMFSPLVTSSSQSSKELSCSYFSSSNSQTGAQLHLLQLPNNSRNESCTLEGSYAPISHSHLNLSTEGSYTSFSNRPTTAESDKEPSNQPQSAECNNLNENAPWSELDPLNETIFILKDLVENLSESTVCSLQKCNRYFRNPNLENCAGKEPPLKISNLDDSSESSSWSQASRRSLPSSSSQSEVNINSVAKSSRSTSEQVSQTMEVSEDSVNENFRRDSGDSEYEKLEKMVADTRSDIKIFATFILNECDKHPEMDLERLYDFKYCYSTFAAEEYKNFEEKLSAYIEIDGDETLKQKILHLNLLKNETDKFLARLQYAVFLLKLYLKFDGEVKQIVMNIREMERSIYSTEGWQTDNSQTNSN